MFVVCSERDPKQILSHLILSYLKHALWRDEVTQCNTRTNGNLSHPWQLVFNCQIMSTPSMTSKHHADGAPVWCHTINCLAIFIEFKNHGNVWKTWLRQRIVKIGLIISLGLTSAVICWFSQGITYNRKLSRTGLHYCKQNIAISSSIWHNVLATFDAL